MKITWSIIKYNFFLYKTYYIVFTLITGFYIGTAVSTNGFVSDNQTAEAASILISKMVFLVFWIACFFDYTFLVNKIFYKNIKNKQQQNILFSKITRQKLFFANFAFFLIYSFSRMLLFFLVLIISHVINPVFHLDNVLWILFNITINAIFITMVLLLFCLATFDALDKQFLIIRILGSFLLFATILTNLFNSAGEPMFIAYIPLFGLTSSMWIEAGAWQQYLNLPISLVGIIVLGIINLKLNQKIEY